MCDVTGHSHWIDNVRCKMHQTRLQVKRTSRLCLKRKLKNKMRFKCKRKITNAKIYEDKRDLYCIGLGRSVVLIASDYSTKYCVHLTNDLFIGGYAY